MLRTEKHVSNRGIATWKTGDASSDGQVIVMPTVAIPQ
jgi:hypothetical protein